MTNTTTVSRAHQSNASQGTEHAHTLMICVVDRPGSVDRVVGVLRRRRSNLQSLSLGFSDDRNIRITAQVIDTEVVIDHLVEQLRKIIDVQLVERLDEQHSFVREVALIQVKTSSADSQTLIDSVQQHGAHVAHQTSSTITFEVTGSPDKVEQVVNALRPYGITDLARSGCVGLSHAVAEG